MTLLENSSKPRILIIDDKKQNRLLISEYLNELDILIDDAGSGKKGLEMLKKKTYHLVILDAQMPQMDGFQVLKEIQGNPHTSEIPVVMVSAIFDTDEHILKAIESGALDYMVKPIKENILLNKINNFLQLFEKQNKLDQMVKSLETMNKRLQESERRFKRITNSAKDAIIVLNEAYQILFWSRAAQIIFEITQYEVLYENFFTSVISPKDIPNLTRFFESIRLDSTSKKSDTIRCIGRSNTGKYIPIEISLASFNNAQNELNYTVVIRDISKQVKTEKEALKAKELKESNRVMKEFMDSVSHELRTPMNAILGISDMLLKYNSENLLPKQKEGLDFINKSGNRLLEMINEVLDLSRLEAKRELINNEEFNLEKFLASIHSMVLSLIQGRNIKFIIRKSSAVPENIVADQKKLNQILYNLLGNAVKFTEKGKIHLYIHSIDNKLYFEVTDTGIGIPPEYLDDIFKKFKQLDNSASKKYKGTGLGLNICRVLIELLQGEIKAESTPGSGTSMKFYLPVNTTSSKSGNELSEQESLKNAEKIYDLDKPLALIINDSSSDCFWYSGIMESFKVNVVFANTSAEGLRKFYNFLPELVILKLEMPRIHGYSIMNEIKNVLIENEISLIALTSISDLKVKDLPIPAKLIHEPVTENVLFKAIREHTKKPVNRSFVEQIVLYEREHGNKNLKSDKNFYCRLGEDAINVVKRRNIHQLVLEGIDLNGSNYQLIKWLKLNPELNPEEIIILSHGKPFKIISDEINELPNARIIDLNNPEEVHSYLQS